MFENILKNKQIETAEKAVENNPDNIIKLHILGELYAKHNFYDKAILTFEKILKIDENYLPSLELLSKVYIKTKQYLKAYRTLLHLYKISEGNFAVKTMLFSLKDADCEIEAKIDILKGLIEIENDINLKEKLADLYIKSGQFVKGAKSYEELFDIEQKTEYLQILAKIYYKIEKFSLAANCLEKLMQNDDFSFEQAQMLADIYVKENRAEEAKGIFELLSQAIPDKTEQFQEKIAQILSSKNEQDEVIAITQNVIENNAYSVEAKFMQADALSKKREFQQAIELLKEFHYDPVDKATEKKIEEKIINLSIIYSQELRSEHKYTEAIDALLPALRYDENNKNIYIELARISTEIRDYSSAKEYMKMAEEL